MRAIDADKLQKQFDEKSTNPNYRVNMHNIKSIISNTPTVETITKADYETRLKADMVAMLTDIQLEMESLRFGQPPRKYVVDECLDIIQQKINELKENIDES